MALAVTGVAGPAEQDDRPVGTVCFGVDIAGRGHLVDRALPRRAGDGAAVRRHLAARRPAPAAPRLAGRGPSGSEAAAAVRRRLAAGRGGGGGGLRSTDRTCRTVRWTRPEAWHVTLRFLGGVAAEDVARVAGALGALRSLAPVVAELGPATRRLGRSVLVVPVAGLGEVAAAVDEALAGVGVPPEERPFRGHLTVARARGRASLPRELAGAPLAGRWVVDEVTLVESTLQGSRGSRYTVLERVPLGAGARGILDRTCVRR